MDVFDVIRQLMEERDKLDARIVVLEERLQWENDRKDSQGTKRRGRKGMSREERLKVSERMRSYWAARRGVPTS